MISDEHHKNSMHQISFTETGQGFSEVACPAQVPLDFVLRGRIGDEQLGFELIPDYDVVTMILKGHFLLQNALLE